ncbi:hypothetical protein BN874_530003 [Candidatus Contendobacter odensis Run_B_J11]|uniref:CheB-type methylesterase domain-containing protein n=1 Tax=Candidatus Contendobacter odensis Run_B_J11 TaxID=1400861 RepID=A0A7U7GED3_9GAMM|nr:hypothetical protein BN874_530003 [Candidatus Contendobacter odensis Run_B_J11]
MIPDEDYGYHNGVKLMSTTNGHPPPEPQSPPPPDAFPIVGIGASAGGLEALELFLSPIPGDSAWRLSSSSTSIPPTRA